MLNLFENCRIWMPICEPMASNFRKNAYIPLHVVLNIFLWVQHIWMTFLSSTQQILLNRIKMTELRQFSILKNVNFKPFRRFFEKQKCGKSVKKFKFTWRCISRNAQNSLREKQFFCNNLVKFIKFGFADQFYVLRHENRLLYNMPTNVLKQNIMTFFRWSRV